MMTLLKNESRTAKPVPSELKAVVHIFSADSELRAKALPHVNLEKQEVNWFAIGRNHFGSGHSAAIHWAKSIWNLQCPKNLDLMENSTAMDLTVRKSVLEALQIAWGI